LTHAAPGFGGQSDAMVHAWPPSGTTVPPPSPLPLDPLEPLDAPLLPLLLPLDPLVPVPVLEELQATRRPNRTARVTSAVRMAGF